MNSGVWRRDGVSGGPGRGAGREVDTPDRRGVEATAILAASRPGEFDVGPTRNRRRATRPAVLFEARFPRIGVFRRHASESRRARAPDVSTSTKCRAQSREEGFDRFDAAGPHMKRGVGKIILRVVESGTLRRGEVLVVRASFFPCWTANESAWENTWRTQANTHLEELIQREKRSPRRVVRPDVRGHEARVVRLVGHAHALAVEQPLPFVVDEPTTVPVRRKEVLAREPVDRF